MAQCGLIPGLSPWASNAPFAPVSADWPCVSNDCSASQCVRMEGDCSTGNVAYSCMDGESSSTANPGVIVAEAVIMVIGIVLVVAKNALIGWRRLIALVLIVWGVHNIGGGMVFANSCDWCTYLADAVCCPLPLQL